MLMISLTMHHLLTWLTSFYIVATSVVLGNVSTTRPNAATYTNPILDKIGADPWVIKHGNYYYMTYTTNDNITILRSTVLTNWNNAELKLAFTPPENTSYTYDLWAPELHQFDNKWYIIFTADVDPDSPKPEQDMLCSYTCPAVNHRMFVLESSGSDPWQSEYTFKSELDTYNQFAIDGTYLQVQGQLYHVYSCWYDAYTSWPAMLCISKSKFQYRRRSNAEDISTSVPQTVALACSLIAQSATMTIMAFMKQIGFSIPQCLSSSGHS